MIKNRITVHQIRSYLLPTLLLTISLPLLSACGHNSDSSNDDSSIVAAVASDGSAGKDFVLNNGGKGAEVAIDFSGEELNSQSNASIGSSFKIVSTSPAVCTIDNNGDDNGYVATFVSASGDCKIDLYSVVKSTTNSSGTIQFSATGKETARYAYTNKGYLMAVGDNGNSSTYHNSVWSDLVATNLTEISFQVSNSLTTLNGTVYTAGLSASQPAVNSYSAANGWGEPKSFSDLGDLIYALTVSAGGVVYAGASGQATDFAIRATNGVWTTSASPLDQEISGFATAPNGTLYAISANDSDNFATYKEGSWSSLSTIGSQGYGIAIMAPDGTLYTTRYDSGKTDQLAIRANDGTWTLVDGRLDGYVYALDMASDGTLYVGSGAGSGNTNFASYDVNGNWTDLSTNNPVNILYTIAVATDNTVYLGGGSDSNNTTFFAAYDPSNNSWQPVTQPLFPGIGEDGIYQLSFYNVLSLQAE